MNIEEQIKIVKNMLLHAETQLLDYEAIAIETLLTAYEKEKETSHYIQSQLDIANAKLVEEKEKNKELNKYIEDRAKIGKDIQTFINKDYVEQEYISKDKIKAKIEELNKDFKEYENGQEWEIQDEIRGQIDVLQSLLEKEQIYE